MKAAEFINLAGTLSVQADAARIRTSISRSYYGAFHLVLTFLHGLGVPCGKRHDLHKILLGSGHAAARDVGILLSYLYEFRQKADYDLLNPKMEASSEAQDCVVRARRIEDLLEQCNQEPARSAIKAGIAGYLKASLPRT
jgi:uncharacterized protein (UPF0332 family)